MTLYYDYDIGAGLVKTSTGIMESMPTFVTRLLHSQWAFWSWDRHMLDSARVGRLLGSPAAREQRREERRGEERKKRGPSVAVLSGSLRGGKAHEVFVSPPAPASSALVQEKSMCLSRGMFIVTAKCEITLDMTCRSPHWEAWRCVSGCLGCV